jgi:hypothetical protein
MAYGATAAAFAQSRIAAVPRTFVGCTTAREAAHARLSSWILGRGATGAALGLTAAPRLAATRMACGAVRASRPITTAECALAAESSVAAGASAPLAAGARGDRGDGGVEARRARAKEGFVACESEQGLVAAGLREGRVTGRGYGIQHRVTGLVYHPELRRCFVRVSFVPPAATRRPIGSPKAGS